MPHVSVVIPVRNGATTIGATLRSVLAQTVTDLEVIVVDDGSTDDTVAVAGRECGSRARILSQSSGGASAARNAGIAAARGALITFIDADDEWAPRKIQRQIQALRGRPGAGLAYSFTDFVDVDGRCLRRGSRRRYEGRVLERLVCTNFLESGSNAMIRREVFDAVGVFDPTLATTEDWDLFLRIAARFDFACAPHGDVRYRLYARRRDARAESIEATTQVVIERGLDLLGKPAPALRGRALAAMERNLLLRAMSDVAAPFPNPRAVSHALRSIRGDETSMRRPMVAATLLAAGILAIAPGPLREVLRGVLEWPFARLRRPIRRE